MPLFPCNCTYRCTVISIVASLIAGILAAFLQITGTIAIPATFLTAAIAAAVTYLAVLLLTAALNRGEGCGCKCASVHTLLAGILGTVTLALILLTVDVAAASVIGAIFTGLLIFFAALTLTATACLIRCLTGCDT